MRSLALSAATLTLLCLATAPAIGAQKSDAQRLIETYAPRLEIREQENPPCDTTAEQYELTRVETVLGNPEVVLAVEGEGGKEIPLKRGPTAADISELGDDHYINIPGDPLGDTCVYAKDFAAMKRRGEAPPTTYAHIAREEGREGLAIQYWFFWYFNQFNDLHEGDWEGMQVVFDSSDAKQALEEGPSEIGLFQHGGGEKGDWESGKVEKEGTHPVVYSAAGSHATFYEAAVYVENGRKGSGVGCDNTTEPHNRLDVRPIQVPTDPKPGSPYAWLGYEGHWGQREKGFNNGPTGPAMKDRWREPLSWMEEIRTTSPRLPVGSILGPTVTNSFCGTVADVTAFLNKSERERWLLIVVPALLVLLVAFVVWRTRWRPVDITELRRTRAFGQLILTAGRLYWHHMRVFVPIGLSAIPIVGGMTALSWLIAGGETGREIDDRTGISGLHVALGEVVAGIGLPIASAIVAAAIVVAIRELDETGSAGFLSAYRGVWRRFGRVVGAQLLLTVAVVLMAFSVIGLPFAAWKYIGWLFVKQRVLFEDSGIRDAFRGSSEIVRGRWWYTLRVAAFLWLLSIIVGPVLGFALIFTFMPLLLINAIGSIAFALMVPYVAIGQTLIYFDLQVAERAPAKPWRERFRRPARAEPARFGAMRILAFSDLHRDLGQAAELVGMAADADVVIGAGDFASIHEGLDEAIAALSDIEAPTVLVPGNNETEEALREAAIGWSSATVLHGAGTQIDGVEFYGLGAGVPVTPWDWSFDLDDDAAAEMLAPCPDGAFLVLHSPPQGHCDSNGAGDHFGSEALLRGIEEKRPRLAVCGHIHESWGCESLVGETPVRNLGPSGTWLEA